MFIDIYHNGLGVFEGNPFESKRIILAGLMISNRVTLVRKYFYNVENYIIKLRKQLEHHNHIDYSQLFLKASNNPVPI